MSSVGQAKSAQPSTQTPAAARDPLKDRLSDGLNDPLSGGQAKPIQRSSSGSGGPGGGPGGSGGGGGSGGPPTPGGGGSPSASPSGGGAPAPSGGPSAPSGGPGGYRFPSLQAKGGKLGPSAPETAAQGLSGHGSPMPFGPVLQASFGGIDLSNVRAHTGPQAKKANDSLGSKAYAMGDDVAFGGTPDLHTAAHEAAHVVQQRKGVSLKDNTGQIGDSYERHADAVADRVVQGKSAADLLAPFAGGSGGSPAVQMAPNGPPAPPAPPAPPTIDKSKFDYPAFKESTYSRWHSRGDELEYLDRWVKAVPLQDNPADLSYTVQQVIDACDVWLKKVPVGEMAAKDYIIKRKNGIEAMRAKADAELKKVGGGGPPPATPPTPPPADPDDAVEMEGNTDDVLEGANGGLDIMGGMGGTIGDYGDIHAVYQDGLTDAMKEKGSAMGKNNANAMDSMKSDILDSANIGTGALGIYGGIKTLADKSKDGHERADGALSMLEGAGNLTHGALKLTKAVRAGGLADAKDLADKLDPQSLVDKGVSPDAAEQLTKGLQGDAESNVKANDALGDIGGVVGDGLSSVAKFGSVINQSIALHNKGKEGGGLTTDEKVDGGLEIGKTALEGTQAGLKAGVGITKLVGGSLATAGGLATAAGAIGIVVGTIQMVQGAIGIYRSYASKKAVKEARELFAKVNAKVDATVREVREKYNADMLKGLVKLQDLIALKAQITMLENQLKALDELKQQVEPALQSMETIQNLRMEDSAFKVAQGGLSVTAGALALSGVGAPVAIALGVVVGILSISQLIVKNARNRAANRLTLVAQRLTDDGRAKATPDESLDYRTLEKRVYKAYYNNLPKVIKKELPTAIEDGEFTDIKHFAWEEKKGQVKGRTLIPSADAAASRNDTEKKTTWLDVPENMAQPNSKIKETEEPGFFAKVNLAFSGDAHKSQMAVKAGAKDIANALLMLGGNSFNPVTKKYVPAPITVEGNLPPNSPVELVEAVKSATFDKLIKAARIPDSRWAAWWTNAGGIVDITDPKSPKITNPDQGKMRDSIASHVGG